jgi:hypothetical protein
MSCEYLPMRPAQECGSNHQIYNLEMDEDGNLYKDGEVYAKVLSIEERNQGAYITKIERISDNPCLNGEVRTIIMYHKIKP